MGGRPPTAWGPLPEKAQDSNATRTLLRLIEGGATACLRAICADATLAIHLDRGVLLAAEASDDTAHYLRRFRLEGALTDRQMREMQALAATDPIFGSLLDAVEVGLLERVLQERFRDNLARFLGGSASLQQTTEAPFVDNLRWGIDAKKTIDEAATLWNASLAVPLEFELTRGTEAPKAANERKLFDTLTAPMPVAQLLPRLPMEPIAARALAATLLAKRVLRIQLPAADKDEDTEVADELTPDETPVPALIVPVAKPTTTRPEPLEDFEEEMDAFTDHDGTRGDENEGIFSTEQHNLDQVHVSLIDDEKEDEPIEVEEAPQAKFAAPPPSEQEAQEKILVINEVLAGIVEIFDEETGPGTGRAALQILLDGAPARFAALLQDLQLDDEGRLPVPGVLENLRQRPNFEHRRLITDGLADLVERMLSVAADELSDPAIDRMLEHAAGYRQRMGL